MSQPRLIFLDRLKTILTVSVVLFHVAIIYGPMGNWYYSERSSDPLVSAILLSIVVYLDAFFMVLFFFISGYSAALDIEKKGTLPFVRARLFRLGIPLLLFMVTLSPIQEWMKLRWTEGQTLTIGDYYRSHVFNLSDLSPGQLWFVGALLVFSLLWAAAYPLFGKRNLPSLPHPSWGLAAMFLIITTLVLYGVRQVFPAGKEYFHLILGNFSQYILYFGAGLVAGRNRWLEGPSSTSKGDMGIAVGLAVILHPILIFGGIFSGGMATFSTGLTVPFFAFTTWQSVFCFFMVVAVLRWSQRRSWKPSHWDREAFGVYIFHAVLTLPFAILMVTWEIHPLWKFVMVTLLGTVASFAVARGTTVFLRKLKLSGRKLLLQVWGPSSKAREVLAALGEPSSGSSSLEEIYASRKNWDEASPELDEGPRIFLEGGAFIQVVSPIMAQGTLVWAHGGGFTAGSARTHQGLAKDLSRATGLTVYLVQYSLSPEAAQGVAIGQLVSACVRAQEASKVVFLGGDSAGGHLALATWEALQREGNEAIRGLILLSPWISLTFPPMEQDEALKKRYRDPMVSPTALRYAAYWYLGSQQANRRHLLPGNPLRRLPPTLIVIGGRELLLDNARKWKRSWTARGARVRISCYPGLWHVWPAWGAELPEARWALEEIATFILTH